MSKVMRAIGLMSGTSMDGIDLALIETDGEDHVRRICAAGEVYPEDFRRRLRQALTDAGAIVDRRQRPGILAQVERELTERHAEAVLRFMGDRMLQPSAIDVIGFHGQTVLHKPAPGAVARMLTVQIGDGGQLAARTGIDVVSDLRAADCAEGGEGAPLVPIYHRALASRLEDRPVAFVNIGGVANVTWIGPRGELIAFDTGPGNALIDDWVFRHTGQSRDEGGRLAGSGLVDADVLLSLASHPYFAQVPPKSLDRNTFSADAITMLSAADGAATLTEFTAQGIARSREHFPDEPKLWIVCGGGRHNRTLMRAIAARVENAVVPAEAISLDGDSMEAEAWAYLAVRSLAGLPITFPGTTGVKRPMPGGILSPAP